MPTSRPPSRQRIVAGAADMLRRRGLTATSIREVAKHAGAPLGSTYHYFPGGKQQLVAEAVQFASDTVTASLRDHLLAGPDAGLRAFLAHWRTIVTGTDYHAGCPILAVVVSDTPSDEAAAAFATWTALLADALRAHGAEPTRADQVATLIVAAVEGAIVLCRADRTAEPLDRIGAQLETLVHLAISDH